MGAKNVIAKSITPPSKNTHPKGWHSDVSHRRKVISYQVEANWYRQYAKSCMSPNHVPHCYGVRSFPKEDLRHESSIILLSDLDEIGFTSRKQQLSVEESKVCIKWLAYFHASFMQDKPDPSWPVGLWPVGSYWHLMTRLNEYQTMPDSPIKRAAHKLDNTLNTCRFKTLIHGDAKIANFCLTNNGKQVAGVDFQYVGAGCGMKDLVYFMGSCLSEHDCQMSYQNLMAFYFSELTEAMQVLCLSIDPKQVIEEWGPLFYVAWADFQRFLIGWSPKHQKINEFSSAITEKGIALVC
ncbi:DUF1679 domain-containing protein [Shewanella sp. D64]|uniref:oxidoreductase family protein n=1 Tax=unclassified Shewanella TaxID=196818 RepID=UPI0022BA4E70|nr:MULTISPECIES: oxidoreductase family protein [unclassified Shewanella]MEC4724038.1 DUF1679 domain-containing protein [Shewanella sp. D64]MEC4736058.1 DUF1679 domain-containing protein [Shewanella sp. E94]WBJ97997.1 DUF1679 domain-containing protein [Shewanella sp. MTB7]